jgi:class 3 adenylate cyclase/tetratricopeptide (TPR) repeat protein
MLCVRCHAQNPDSAQFCHECGGRLRAVCPRCGARVEATNKFCGGCGTSLGLTSAAARAPGFVSPERYTPKYLAEKILISKAALEGERKQVTVLFADVRGSMELLADRDPEEARKLLDPVLERMMEAVHRYEGTVNQVMGDGIMALFGAPLAHEDHAVRACYAGLWMQDAVRRFADELRRQHGLDVQIRVGMNSGEVVVRSVGNDLRMDYSAVGRTTHLAARMEQLARPGAILITSDTLRLVEGYVEVVPLGPVPIRGLAEPVDTYELVRAGVARSRLEGAARRGLTRFVGRGSELERLERAMGRARVGHGQLVALVGEPGVGKSRLVWEFAHSPRTRDWLVLEGSSVAYGKGSPYLPVIDVLRRYCRIEDRDDVSTIRTKVTERILALDESLGDAVPALLSLFDANPDDSRFPSFDPPLQRQRTLEAIQSVLLRASQGLPLLVILEDLQWIDSETQACLDALVEKLARAAILVMVNYRPDYQHRWGRESNYTEIRLEPLAAPSADELLGTLLGDAPELRPLKQLLVERTQGNPFFLEESVRTLVETRVLQGERRAYRVAGTFASIQVPPTVQAVLTARIDRLPPEEKRLLQTASVIGKDVPLAVLQVLAELPEDVLRRTLADLQASEFLYETSSFPGPEYTFKHALTHDVAYGSLLQERRRTLHARIVEVIEQLHPHNLSEHFERLGYHALRGTTWDKAVFYLQRAGTRAAARSANREAVAYFEQALEALNRLPASRETREREIALRLHLGTALLLLAQPDQVSRCLREAERVATDLDDQGWLGRISSFMSQHLWLMGDGAQAAEAGERALAIGRARGDIALQIRASFFLGEAYQALGDYRRAMEFLRWTADSVEGKLRQNLYGMSLLPSVSSRAWMAWCLGELGDFETGIAAGQDGILMAKDVDHRFSLVIAYFGLGALYVHKGDFREAIAVLDQGLRLHRELELPFVFPLLASHLGLAYARSGRRAEGAALLDEALAHAVSTKLLFLHSFSLASRSWVYLMEDHLDEALTHAGRALELCRARGERGEEAWTLRLLGEITSRVGAARAEEASDYYRRALARASELEMRPLIAHCHLGLGGLRHGPTQAAAPEHLAMARALFEQMQMTYWAAEADTAPSGRD